MHLKKVVIMSDSPFLEKSHHDLCRTTITKEVASKVTEMQQRPPLIKASLLIKPHLAATYIIDTHNGKTDLSNLDFKLFLPF